MSRILIICRAFAPDSVVGAKRMAMLAKYLKCTNEVIVIRSGLIFGKPDTDSMLNESETLRIISYEGDNSPANKFEKGEWITDNSVSVKKRISLLRKGKVYTLLKRVYRFFIYYKDNYHVYKNAKKVASKICEDNSIDVVITTYSPLGTTACGYYLKKKYGLKWIMDLYNNDLQNHLTILP